MSEIPAARLFRVHLADDRRVILTITAEEDHSLPSPGERPDWQPYRPSHAEIRAALATLHCSTDLVRHEFAWKRQEKNPQPTAAHL